MKKTEARLRILSAGLLAPVFLGLLALGAWFTVFLLVVMGCVLWWEWSKMMQALWARTARSGDHASPATFWLYGFMATGSLFLCLSLVAGYCQQWLVSVGILSVGLGVFCLWRVFRGFPLLVTLAGFGYTTVPLALILWLRVQVPHGLDILLWIVLCVWACDTMAYMTGKLVGGRKIWPRVSKGKTWSGFCGGLAGGGVTSVAVGMVVLADFAIDPVFLLCAGGVLALLVQMGDFAVSFVKRLAGVKDSGNLIPGHGGIWDRFDGMMLAVIMVGLALLVHTQLHTTVPG